MAGRDIGSLIAELENPDESNLMDTIFALKEKMDPLAVDSLIKKFSHQNPQIWYSVALAVGRIAGHGDTPAPIRSEVFSKIVNLLSHENPQVRKTAATALGDMAGDSAAREVMRLFEDPDASVRQTGVFVIGFLRYKPALSAVKRLTRDRSKSVRRTAKRVLRELSSELC
jgi:HEAT repeat protein